MTAEQHDLSGRLRAHLGHAVALGRVERDYQESLDCHCSWYRLRNRLLKPVGLFPIPKLLHESFEGRCYPNAYTALDKIQFRRFSAEARKFYEPFLARMSQHPSIDMFRDDTYLDGVPRFTGVPCEAGHRFVSIRPNGNVFRCGPGWFLGNILRGTFALRSGAAPCDST
jgi:hypothetical protein